MMARTTKDFRDEDLITYAMNGRMIVVKDDGDVTLIIENVVRYTNSTIDGLISFLKRQRKNPASWMPETCCNNISALIFKIQKV